MRKKLFDIAELRKKSAISVAAAQGDDAKAQARSLQFLQEHYQRIESVKQLMGAVPAADAIWFLWSLHSFNAFTFVPYLLAAHGKIQHLSMSTYTVNMRIADALFRMADTGQVQKISLYISDSLKFRMPKVVDHLQSLQQSRPGMLEVFYCWNHSKITLAHCGSNYYTIEGSGNWSENARYEQYLFANKKELYDFRLQCLTSLLETIELAPADEE